MNTPHAQDATSTNSLVACPECDRMVSKDTATCPECGGPIPSQSGAAAAAPGTAQAKPAGRGFWRTSLADFAREGASKNTTLGRRIWIWCCFAGLALYFLLNALRVV